MDRGRFAETLAQAPVGDPGDAPDWPREGPLPVWDLLWDALDPDDELDEPQPESGDFFWPQPDGDEAPWR